MKRIRGDNVGRLTRSTVALILAGGRGARLYELTALRAKPAAFFGGKFRIIDFTLSNCVNSGIHRIGVLTQYKSHSLIRHLFNGWNIYPNTQGKFLEILPAPQRTGSGWYSGTADAVYQNLDIIRYYNPEFTIVLSSDHVYKMDYGEWLLYHHKNDADITIACVTMDSKQASRYGVPKINEGSPQIIEFQEKKAVPAQIPGNAGKSLISMGNYIFRTEILYDILVADANNNESSHDFGKDIIPAAVSSNKVIVYPFYDAQNNNHYWRDVGTMDAYWKANLELLDIEPELNIYDNDWPIMTYQKQLPPTKFIFEDKHRTGTAVNSMVADGCIISGAKIRHSLLHSNVHVSSFSLIENSVIMPDVKINRNCTINNAIIDRGCVIPRHSQIGIDLEKDKLSFRVSDNGVVLVTPQMLDQPIRRHI